MLLPAVSVVVTLASMVVSPSATKSLPGTLILNAPLATAPVKVLLFTVRVTMSPSWTSPPTAPVMAMSVPSSAALIISSAVILASRVILAAGGVVSTV